MSPPRTACASPAEKDVLCVPTIQPQNQPQSVWPPSTWPVLGDGHVSGHASAWNFSGLTDLSVLGEASYSAEHGHLGLSVLGRPRWDTANVVGARCLPGLPWEVTPSAIVVSLGSALGSGTSISHQTQVLEPWCPQPAPRVAVLWQLPNILFRLWGLTCIWRWRCPRGWALLCPVMLVSRYQGGLS